MGREDKQIYFPARLPFSYREGTRGLSDGSSGAKTGERVKAGTSENSGGMGGVAGEGGEYSRTKAKI